MEPDSQSRYPRDRNYEPNIDDWQALLQQPSARDIIPSEQGRVLFMTLSVLYTIIVQRILLFATIRPVYIHAYRTTHRTIMYVTQLNGMP